ncbi:hypothetical protein [Chitinophaga sp. LS1]|uniref:hypothetical protein n=1 Tax=Chitinophaga sp. LS1 TaxID=3051176 RepID=UPI002AAC4D63|nr:hypothetical protein [Chitinophaga sp. LS1]WPV67503.1 hypothetical protein QQL36_02030 [Chitinophaga sp. LS1]
MAEKDLFPSEYENEIVKRLVALVNQKLADTGNTSEPNDEEKQLIVHSRKNFPILSDSAEALRIIKDAEVREREGLKRQIVKIAHRIGFTVKFNERLGNDGGVDIVLEKDNLSIACFMFNCGHLSCEPNIIKLCLQSDFDFIVVCSLGKGHDDKIGFLLGDILKKISVIALSDFADYLDRINCNNFRKEYFFKGRKVVIEYKKVSEVEAEMKSNIIKRVLSKGRLRY